MRVQQFFYLIKRYTFLNDTVYERYIVSLYRTFGYGN